MKKTFLYLALSIFVITVVVFMMNMIEEKPQDPAHQFLTEVTSTSRYVNADELAKRIIDGDPTLLLIDVRSKDEFNEYSLPGAVNIPLEQITEEGVASALSKEGYNVVFFSNDDFNSEMAWALGTQQGYRNLYVLEGGLNKWFSTIMLPKEPNELASRAEMDLYEFRKGASIYFGSGTIEVPVVVELEVEQKPTQVPKKTIPVKKKVKVEAEGGC